MANYRQAALDGGALFSKYCNLNAQKRASVDRRVQQSKQIEDPKNQLRILNEQHEEEVNKGKKLEAELDDTMKKLLMHGQVTITHGNEVATLNYLRDNMGYHPRVYCQNPNLWPLLYQNGYAYFYWNETA